MSVHKVLITGTGRTGTSFLVGLLTYLGFDTGFTEKEIESVAKKRSKAGLEKEVGFFKKKESGIKKRPYIIKCPSYSYMIKEMYERCIIDHVYIPIRDINEATSSRMSCSKGHGGRWKANNERDQKAFLLRILGLLITDLTLLEVPRTFLIFNKLISDPEYCYNKLNFLCSSIDKKKFIKTFNKVDLLFKK